jgi:hypothetical protein
MFYLDRLMVMRRLVLDAKNMDHLPAVRTDFNPYFSHHHPASPDSVSDAHLKIIFLFYYKNLFQLNNI